MKVREIGEIVTWIVGAYASHLVNADISAMTRAYVEGLGDLEVNSCQRAVRELLKTEKRVPSIADIRARVVANSHGERRLGIEAWKDVIGEVRRAGRNRLPEFADQFVLEAVRSVGGWSAVCDSEAGGAAIRARFCESYDALVNRAYREVQVSPGAKARALPPPRAESAKQLGQVISGLLQTGEDTDDE